MNTVSVSLVKCATSPACASRPPCSTMMRSQVRSTSAIRCDEKSTLIPNSRCVFLMSDEHLLAASGIEPRGRFVEENERGVVHQRLAELDALLHAGGVPADGAVALLEETDVAQRVSRAGARHVRWEPAHLRHVREEFRRTHLTGQAIVLRHVTDACADRDTVGRDHAEHARRARRGTQEAEQDLDDGALAGAVLAENARDPIGDVEGDVVERHDLAVALGDVINSEQRLPGNGNGHEATGSGRLHDSSTPSSHARRCSSAARFSLCQMPAPLACRSPSRAQASPLPKSHDHR